MPPRKSKAEPYVEPYDSALRYLVQSDSEDGVVYLADLGEMRCTCRDWECRRWPLIQEGRRDWGAMCKHLRAALIALGLTARDRLVEVEAEQQNQGNQ
jgi:hypothetical protein